MYIYRWRPNDVDIFIHINGGDSLELHQNMCKEEILTGLAENLKKEVDPLTKVQIRYDANRELVKNQQQHTNMQTRHSTQQNKHTGHKHRYTSTTTKTNTLQEYDSLVSDDEEDLYDDEETEIPKPKQSSIDSIANFQFSQPMFVLDSKIQIIFMDAKKCAANNGFAPACFDMNVCKVKHLDFVT